MSWKIVKRRLGRAGSLKMRTERQQEWDKKYGEGKWEIGYSIDNRFVSQQDAFELIYFKSYEEHFKSHPEDLHELINLAKKIRNPHADATTSIDLQVYAIELFLIRNKLKLSGQSVVDIGSWQGKYSHPISVRLSPLHIKLVGNPKMTLEKFWQSKKCLAIWIE